MRFLVVLMVLVALFAAPLPAADAPKPSEKVKKLFGEKALTVLDGATKVEVFRVDSDKPGEKDKTVAGYRITAPGKDQDEKFAAKIAAAVLDEKNYEWEAAKGCIFRPGVAFRVWKGEESVAFVICFSCDQMDIATLGKDGTKVKSGFAETDPGRAALVKLAKAAFPDDKEIQKLKESR
jgi:hypothetical protein